MFNPNQLNKLNNDLISVLTNSSFQFVEKAQRNYQSNQFFSFYGKQVKALNSIQSGSDIFIFKDLSSNFFAIAADASEESGIVSSRTVLRRHTKPFNKVISTLKPDVAVIYSIEVGEFIEFWVKTNKIDIKIHQIPKEIETGQSSLVPVKTVGDTVYWGPPGTDTSNISVSIAWVDPDLRVIYQGVGWVTEGGETQIDACNRLGGPRSHPNVGSSATEPDTTRIYNFGLLSDLNSVSVDTFYINNATEACFNGAFPPDTSYSYSWGLVVNGTTEVNFAFGEDDGRGLEQAAAGYYNLIFSGPNSEEILPGDETGPFDPPTGGEPSIISNPYEAFISSTNNKIFTLIKSNLNNSDEIYGEIKYQSLVKRTLTDLGNSGDTFDWRNEAVSLTPTSEITSSDSCVNDYLYNPQVNLINNTLYQIDLEQNIGGDTLISKLQTSAANVNATLTTQQFNSGASCTLDPIIESKIKVPSPGRGEIEGITYIPPKTRR